jgi:flagellar export protein FliJ
MPFIFSLQTLLRLRELNERAELQTLQSLAAQTAAVRAEIESLTEATEEQKRAMCRDSLEGLSGADLQFQTLREAASRQRHNQLAEKLKELERAREAQQETYRQARKERETLSTLREQYLEAYKQEQLRRTQHELDDTFLIRFSRDKRARSPK